MTEQDLVFCELIFNDWKRWGETDGSLERVSNIGKNLIKQVREDFRILREEIRRLQEGNFTEREFQNLCHNFTDCDRKRFEEGCREYQDRLFGPKGEL